MPDILFWKTKGAYPAGKKNIQYPLKDETIHKKGQSLLLTDMNDIIIFAGMGV